MNNLSLICKREQRLNLPQVTLCAVTSVNVPATLRALQCSLEQVQFGESLLFTDKVVADLDSRIEAVRIPHLASSHDYSQFMLKKLCEFIRTPFCLVVQWDGYVLDARRWREDFLTFDYIGATWPQFTDGHLVGNGGFSLRSKRLLDACSSDPDFLAIHPEDVAISRVNRHLLERHGLRFADPATADAFSAERAGDVSQSFGFHGVFNMVQASGPEHFWQIYSKLEEFKMVQADRFRLARQLLGGGNGLRRALSVLMKTRRRSGT